MGAIDHGAPKFDCRSLEHGGGPFGRLGRLPLGLSPATWKIELMAHLNRYKRYPSGAASTGTASVAFTIARSGQVLSAHLIGSSGNPALDAEAVSLPRRASPVPAPPPDFGGGALTLTVPIHFGG